MTFRLREPGINLFQLGATFGMKPPDLAQWAGFHGDCDKITPWAWAEWDHLHEVRQRMQKLSAREASTLR